LFLYQRDNDVVFPVGPSEFKYYQFLCKYVLCFVKGRSLLNEAKIIIEINQGAKNLPPFPRDTPVMAGMTPPGRLFIERGN
jgi:hypothetical protein